ncbi:hypothetical protein M8J77_009277 [Diaphorina citri]|nr:hypothetical protein M8J77_009277 [Diaphorina citri]
MNEYVDPHFIRALCKTPERRTLQDLQIIYYGLHGLEALAPYRDSVLRSLCRVVRYERHQANDVLYYTGELSTSWYILLSGSVFIDGSMFLPQSRLYLQAIVIFMTVAVPLYCNDYCFSKKIRKPQSSC